LTRDFRGASCIDGSFLSAQDDYGIGPTENVVSFDFQQDPAMKGRQLEFVKTMSKDAIRNLLEAGKQYGAVMEAEGAFEVLR